MDLARQLCEGGADLIQLRAKRKPQEEIRRWAKQILTVTRENGVPLVINDYPSIAVEVGADFCHMGQEDFFDRGYRTVSELSPSGVALRVGLSTHAPEQAQRAVDAGPDYVAIGPVYATPTKPSAPPVTLEYVRWASRHLTLPWFAIGGINLGNLDEIMEAGARRICIVSALLEADNVTDACREFKARLS